MDPIKALQETTVGQAAQLTAQATQIKELETRLAGLALGEGQIDRAMAGRISQLEQQLTVSVSNMAALISHINDMSAALGRLHFTFNPTVKFKKLHNDAQIPTLGTTDAGCYDLHVVGVNEKGVQLADWNGPVVLGTGLAVEIPPTHFMAVFSRSGHGFKYDVRLANGTGIIDADYRDEIMVKLTPDTPARLPEKDPTSESWTPAPRLTVKNGDRIAQCCLIPRVLVSWMEVETLSTAARTGGFGSTGA